MGLFQLIQQYQAIGPSAHRLGELAAFLVAHIAGRGADKPGHRVLFHKLRHIQPDHSILTAVKLPGKAAAQLRFAHSGGAGEQQARHRSARIPKAANTPTHRLGNHIHSRVLPGNLLLQKLRQPEQLFPAAHGEFAHRNAGTVGYRPGDVRPGDGAAATGLGGELCHRLHLIPQGRGLLKIALPNRLLQLTFQFLPKGIAGRGHCLHPGMGRPLVQQVDGFIRQKQIRQITDRQFYRLLQRILGDANVVVLLQARL